MLDGLGDAMNFLVNGFIVALVVAILAIAGFGFMAFKKPVVKSDHKIEPKIELVIKNNRVDTVYIYQK